MSTANTILVAIDVGVNRTGVAAIRRRAATVDKKREWYLTVETHTLTAADVPRLLNELQPRVALIEEPAYGRWQEEARRAVKDIRKAAESLGTIPIIRHVLTWKKECFGTPKPDRAFVERTTRLALADLVPDEAEQVWENAGPDERSALVILMLWRPKEMALARGYSKVRVSISKHTGGKSGRRRHRSKGAQRLYEVLWLMAKSRSRSGQRLQCEAAHISPPNYWTYLTELEDADMLEVYRDAEGHLTEILL